MDRKRIYLDYGATTPVDERVLAAMLPYWTEVYGNPSSTHANGRSAQRALEDARATIADLLHAQPDEIIFTGCGSESDNLAVRGVMGAAQASGRGNHLIVSAIEHGAVLQTAVQLRDHFACDLTILPVDEQGQISLADLEAAIRPDTVLISMMAANNEIGSFQPIQAIGELARERGILFHTDAIQAAAVRRFDLSQEPIDLLSLAPHKFYGPKGFGVLYAREGIELLPALTGGGQENGRRAGTSNVAYAVGTAVALQLVADELGERTAHYRTLTAQLTDGLLAAFPDTCRQTGHPTDRLPHNASFAFRRLSGNDLLMHLDMAGISASSGSACKSGNPKPSAILQAIGLDERWSKGGLRFTVGHQTNPADIDATLSALQTIIPRLQKLEQKLEREREREEEEEGTFSSPSSSSSSFLP